MLEQSKNMTSKDNDNNIDIDEIVYDGDNESTSLSDATEKIKKIKDELKICKEERQEYLDGWQRSKADFMNLKKRSLEENSESRERAIENFVIDLLPVLDSFDMAFKDKEAWESAPIQWRKGIEYIYTQLQNTLSTNSIDVLNPIGANFDPNIHNSVENVSVSEKENDGKIIEVVMKGYKIKDRILRPAHVKVGSFES